MLGETLAIYKPGRGTLHSSVRSLEVTLRGVTGASTSGSMRQLIETAINHHDPLSSSYSLHLRGGWIQVFES